MMAPWMISSSFCFLMILLCYSAIAQVEVALPAGSPSANLSTIWISHQNASNSILSSIDDSRIIPVLIKETNLRDQYIVCGFFCNGTCTSYVFSIFIFQYKFGFLPSHVIWFANEDHPTREGATLNFTAAGELVLQDVDGTKVWTTNTAGKSVVGMNLTGTGNLVLFDAHNSVVWQSYDHPKDCLLLGQTLFQGQKLISSVSSTNWSKGMYSLQITNEGLFGYVESNPPQIYNDLFAINNPTIKERVSVGFLNGSFTLFNEDLPLPTSSSAQYMKLMPNGHLQLFQWLHNGWSVADDLLTDLTYGECFYPLACGRNAVCSADQQCSCPRSNFGDGIDYFKLDNTLQPNLGCSEITPLTCNATQDQHFIPLENIDYSTFTATLEKVSMEACKQACLNNCSCKAALFRYQLNPSSGDCCLPSDLFTIARAVIGGLDYNTSAFIKVQNATSPPSSMSQTPLLTTPPTPSRKNRVAAVLRRPPTIAGIVVLVVVVLGVIMFIVHKRKQKVEMEEKYLDQVPGRLDNLNYSFIDPRNTARDEIVLTQLPHSLLSGPRHEAKLKNDIIDDTISYELFSEKDLVRTGTSDLKISLEDILLATNRFSKANIIARSGFGKVYRGQSAEYGLVAIKQLDRMHGQGDREFWMEISLLSICKHENIVSLVGFCDENGEKILVYKYEINGSLDRHLRSKDLTWMHRLGICLGAACGLKYLHDDIGRHHRVIHRDMKSANILLDENWKPKISDFGLSKFAPANVPFSALVSNPCGTPGYVDPQYVEHSTLTQKSDVYSFGVVLFEVLFGRKVTVDEHPDENHFSVKMARNHFEKETLEEMIIDADLKSQMNSASLSTFSSIAYECLKEQGEERPKMIQVIEQLKKALNYQQGDEAA